MTGTGPSSTPAPSGSTIDDVARLAGVSPATVSRALRDHPYVADATRAKVLEAVQQLNYVANPHAARLASGTTRTVGLMAPLLTSWYTSEIVAGVEEVLTEAGYDLLISTTAAKDRELLFRGNTRLRQRADGLLLVDVFCSEEGAARLAGAGLPVVVLGERLDALHSVSVDNVAGAAMAAEHLLSLGHRHIAMVEGPSHIDTAHNVPSDRRAGFLRALRTHGVELSPALRVDGGFSIQGGRAAMHRLLELGLPPTAVFLMSDEMAFGALHALREVGLRPGDDISIIGFDDHPVSDSVGLTTVRQRVRDIGRTGAHTLLAQLRTPSQPEHVPIDLELVQRTSTKAVIQS